MLKLLAQTDAQPSPDRPTPFAPLPLCIHSSRVIITASAVNRGPKRVDLKAIVDEACQKAAAAGYRDINKILVFEKSALPRWVGLWMCADKGGHKA